MIPGTVEWEEARANRAEEKLEKAIKALKIIESLCDSCEDTRGFIMNEIEKTLKEIG